MTVTTPASRGTAVAPRISVGGTLLPETWLNALTQLRVELGVGMIGRATARFVDTGYALAKAGLATIGADLVIKAKGVADSEAVDDVFTGVVTTVGMEQRADGVPMLVVVAHDRAYELARKTTVAAPTNVTVTKVISDIAGVAGLSASVRNAPTEQQPYLPQADTFLGLLDELTRRSGLDWVVDGKQLLVWRSWGDGGRTTASPSGSTITLGVSSGLTEFSVTVSADAPTEVLVTGWDPVAKKQLTSKKTPGRDGVPSSLASAVGLTKAKAATVQRAAESPDTAAEATALAQAHGRAGSVVLRGRSTVQPRLSPGGLVTLTDVGPASGTYFVQEVEHVFSAGGFDTRFVAGDRTRPALLAAGRPGATSLRRTSLVVAQVTNVQDPEALGRVKLKFPGVDMTLESSWARIAHPGSGKGAKGTRGALWLPEIGDQVLVGFEDGDARHPVVLGGLLGTDPGFPAALRSGANVKVRRIASHKGARLDLGDGDQPAEEFILLALDGDENKLRIGKDRADLQMPDGKPLRIAVGSSSITFDGNGAITIKGMNITLDADTAVKVKGSTVAIEATGSADLKGAIVNVKASGPGTVEAGGPLALKGVLVQVN